MAAVLVQAKKVCATIRASRSPIRVGGVCVGFESTYVVGVPEIAPSSRLFLTDLVGVV